MRDIRTLLACAVALSFATDAALAQMAKYPARPVRLVVPFAAGGTNDILGRIVAEKLAEKFGQPFVADNRAGANTVVGSEIVARATADGHTLLIVSASIAVNPSLVRALPYDTLRDFAPIGMVAGGPYLMVIHPAVPAKTVVEFIAWAKQQKDPIPYGSGGIGSIGHIVGELFAKEAGIKLNHIGYKGSSPMHNDLLGGTILFAIDTLPQNVQFQKSGKLRLLAVTSSKRATMAPDVPNVVELGYPKLVADNFFGISGPANLPRPVVDAIHKATMSALDDPKLVKNFEDVGIAVQKMSPEEFTAFVQKQVTEWAPAVKASGAKLN